MGWWLEAIALWEKLWLEFVFFLLLGVSIPNKYTVSNLLIKYMSEIETADFFVRLIWLLIEWEDVLI